MSAGRRVHFEGVVWDVRLVSFRVFSVKAIFSDSNLKSLCWRRRVSSRSCAMHWPPSAQFVPP